MGLIACLYRAAEWRYKQAEVAAMTWSSTSTGAAADRSRWVTAEE
jgi:hypothetical protein